MSTTTGLGASGRRRVAACDSAPEFAARAASLGFPDAPVWPDAPVCPDALVCLPVAVDRFEVSRSGVVVGFIDRVGHVFVVLTGQWYAVAVESRQVLTLDEAVAAFR